MQWMTPYLIVLIHCIQASSYLLIHNLIVLIHCIQCVLGAAAHIRYTNEAYLGRLIYSHIYRDYVKTM